MLNKHILNDQSIQGGHVASVPLRRVAIHWIAGGSSKDTLHAEYIIGVYSYQTAVILTHEFKTSLVLLGPITCAWCQLFGCNWCLPNYCRKGTDTGDNLINTQQRHIRRGAVTQS